MRLIIHDVESIVPRGNMYAAEIIEIAAVAIDMVNDRLKYKDRFHAYVKPQNVHSLPLLTTQFTGITPSLIENADPFPMALDSFLSWLGDADYYLCSWSLSDRDYFIADCRRHGVSTDWIQNYNDIQKWYGRVRGETRRRTGLSRAMEQLGILPIGSAHSAMADAVNTCRILEHVYDPSSPIFKLDKNDCKGVVHAQLVYEDKDAEDEDPSSNPFARLKDLLSETPS